ncbi:MAG: hypothetical protein K0U72_09215 [Gammaproteobacteria bacterium]|nr:hypothetical protein [Gammaproteobacteria bacterium]
MFTKKSFFSMVISACIAGGILTVDASAQDAPTPVGGGIELMPQFFSDEVVKGAPVAATITTKTVQQLFDGNRIVHEDITQFVRDSEGRVRREELSSVGQPFATYSVSDPTTGISFTVNEQAKTVFKRPSFPGLVHFGVSAVPVNAEAVAISSGNVTILEKGVREEPPRVIGGRMSSASIGSDRTPDTVVGGTTVAFGGHGVTVRAGMPFGIRGSAHSSVQPLGQETIDGVRVEGTLHTTTYPAGVLGNEKPIIVEKRSWFSPELRMMVRSEETDPRFGTITYKAKITNTDDPDVSLFEIPTDYDVVEPGILRVSPIPP